MKAIPAAVFHLDIGALLRKQARIQAHAVAVCEGQRSWTYEAFNERVNRLATLLAAKGVGRGVRIAILSENRHEYLEAMFAAAKLGALLACLNWRFADPELTHSIRLVTPALVLASPRFAASLDRLDHGVPDRIVFGDDYEASLSAASADEPDVEPDPEDGLLILYTSGTTGLPKGAVISQRAMIARLQQHCADKGVTRRDAFYAWSPMFHMAATDSSMGTIMLGGKVIIADGLDIDQLVDVIEGEYIGWLMVMPGMVDRLLDGLRRRVPRVKGIRMMGAMADLVPRHMIAELTTLLNAPYVNSFGSTEAGSAPASAGYVAIGDAESSLSKRESTFIELRLIDAEGRDVADGVPGEALVRGPTLFSGYWGDDATNAQDFRGGWFHSGDMLVRNPDGSLDFFDRVKYLIKSGGENIYPAEIERVLMADARVADAVVVRRPDAQWGEVPVAMVARRDDRLTSDDLIGLCRGALAGYKQPKEIRFVDLADFPRSATGKIQRHEVEKLWRSGE